MIWLYWRRLRAAVLVTCITLGALAALAVVAGSLVGSSHQQAERGAAVSGTGAAVSGTGAPPRHLAGPPRAAQATRGISLMTAAAVACQSVSYSGIQMVAWWDGESSSAYLIQIWHRSDEPEFAEGSTDAGASAIPGAGAGEAGGQPTVDGHVTAGVLSVSLRALTLLRANYLIGYSGTGSANSRPALIVSVWRKDGTLAAQYWLDRATGLPLRRQMFDSGGHLVNEGAYIDLKIGTVDADDEPAPGARAWSAAVPATALADMRRRGWPVPQVLAKDLALVAVTTASTRSGSVLDASYSDGLSVVSVFVQRGQLPETLPGWHQADVSGLAVYTSEPDERSLTWSANGFVYTVIADAPRDTVQRVVAGLPHDHGVGFWERVDRGLKRIGSWFNPFG